MTGRFGDVLTLYAFAVTSAVAFIRRDFNSSGFNSRDSMRLYDTPDRPGDDLMVASAWHMLAAAKHMAGIIKIRM